MYDDYQEHIEDIEDTFAELMADKYEKGQKEHGGHLWDMPEDELLDNAIDEAIDQVVYLLTLKQKREAHSDGPNSDPQSHPRLLAG